MAGNHERFSSPTGRGGKFLPAFCATCAARPHWHLGGIKGTGDSVFSKAAEGEVSGSVKAVIGVPEHGEEAEEK